MDLGGCETADTSSRMNGTYEDGRHRNTPKQMYVMAVVVPGSDGNLANGTT